MKTAILKSGEVSLFFLLFILVQGCAKAQTNKPATDSVHYTKLVWQDEFDQAGSPDPAKWHADTGYLRNNELQYYTNRTENAVVNNGMLVITARNDSFQRNGHVYPITSAALSTQGIKDWTYGRIEVRAKIPSSLGTWPAIWMLGSNVNSVGWPDCGELDMMENVGYMPDTLHFNVHTKKYNHVIHTNKGSRIYLSSPEKDFHVYAIEWSPYHIDWFFDGSRVFRFQNENTGVDAWPFNKPQFLILNLAFGGDWGGAKGVDISSLPKAFYIDYVRVYQ